MIIITGNNMIKQVRFSKGVKFFEKGFCKRWNVTTYKDINNPCFFVGVYNMQDVKVINNHKGLKVLWHPGRVRDVFVKVDYKHLIVVIGKGVKFDIPDRYNKKIIDIPIKDFIQLKDFSPYKPVPLGDKVYAYLGRDAVKKELGYDIIWQLDKLLPFEFIYGYQGYANEYVRNEYYKKSFINIKPHITSGLTTAIEMAYMGRKTVSNAQAPFMYGYETIDDICSIIEDEATKIGQMPKPLVTDDFFFNDWQDLKHWI